MTTGTNVPPPTFGPNGFIAPSSAAILAGVQADINAAFGGNLNFAANTPQGQLAASMAAIIANTYQLFQYYTTQVDPAYAIGRMQDAIGRIYFLERNPGAPTSIQLSCSGLTGVVIPIGALVVDTSGNIYTATSAGTIPAGGTVTVPFAAAIPGPIAVPNTVQIYQAITGWDSATVVSGEIGSSVETASEFEARREASVAANSFGAIGSIIGAVAEVPGVLDYYGYNNNTAAPVTVGGVTIAANAIYVCVAGGIATAVGQAILSKKGPGAPMTGNTSVTVYDSNPLYAVPIPYTITFQVPASLQILFAVNIVNTPSVPASAATLVQNAIIAAFNTGLNGPKARIGQTVYATAYIAAIAALGTWAQVSMIQVGSTNSPDAVVVGYIVGSTLHVASVTSGTILLGDYIFDPLGLITPGTFITAFGTGTGGIGTYTLNNSMTVAGATFTGTGSGTNLTTSAVTGTIGIGDVVTGTGVPGNTTIVSQTSGTIGGAGVYVTSNATTSSGASLTANSVVQCASADHSSASVNINQSPQTSAPSITVTVS